ncbi:hypothetical protein [Scandinavium lactucae]|uniref:Phage-related protein n=1 Tax=Scandinavium lactucae TaxID=3095028 RepID=A0ABU4QUP4_9ENTR|nr:MULTISPECIES: hypothetical protein [unclassified Scandinavium]MDX6043008.1 hypothetical protein [Scandinavium sp. V105_6]MDX6053009.1 hypothetical protein [Scandinavium sp. V105_1]
MNKLNKPVFKDYSAFKEMSSNRRLKHYSVLNGQDAFILNAYKEYIKNKGFLNVNSCGTLSGSIAEALKYYYKEPVKCISIIDEIRAANANSLCSMCGSMHSGTLDHVLPKESYPEFAVFTKNLVPACKCNTFKSTTISNAAGHRMLHPYFDNVLCERLIRAEFTNLGQTPTIDVKIIIDPRSSDFNNVKYHLDNVVIKNDIKGYLSQQWESFYLYPELIVRGLNKSLFTYDDALNLLIRELSLLDEKHKGKNNWNSVFVAGLIHPDVIEWILYELHLGDRETSGRLK